jgi:hypothetical protein
MLRVRPEGELGPRYKITWLLRTPTGKSRLYQDAYPYAEPHPLTYMARGQTFYDGMTTNGGWYVSGPELEKTLLESVKATKPRPPSKSGISSGNVIGIAAASTVTFLAIALLLLIRLRRRSHATVTA